MDELITKYLESNLTEQEEIVLYEWVRKDEQNLDYFKVRIAKHGISDSDFMNINSEASFKKLKSRIETNQKPEKTLKLSPIYKFAATILLLLGLAFLINENLDNPVEDGVNLVDLVTKGNNSQITLKLADGTLKVIGKDKEVLSYTNKSYKGEELAFNELIVPRGEVFKIILSDSTIVWLNADSKLRYPKYFIKDLDSRKVILEGEAYFDVAHNTNQPFIVTTNSIDVKVLGTEFNVSSYPNHETVSTTLVKGSVSINEKNKQENSILITPNHQASFNKNSNVLSSKFVNTENYTAWIQKRIVFDDLPFAQILEKIERVYNVDIKNNDKKLNQERFTGEFDVENIEVIFKALSNTINFEYEINQNQIIIKK